MSNSENKSDVIAINLIYAAAASHDMKIHYNKITNLIDNLTNYVRNGGGDTLLILEATDALRDVQQGIAGCMAEITKSLNNIADIGVYADHNKVDFEYNISPSMKGLIDEAIEHRKNVDVEKVFSVSERMVELFVSETGRSEKDAEAWLCNYFHRETNPALN